jgi:hypothetical protein
VPRVPMDEKNVAAAFGARESVAMNFSEEDRAPEALLNEIIWRSVKGRSVGMPPPRRSAFARSRALNAEVAEWGDDDRDR